MTSRGTVLPALTKSRLSAQRVNVDPIGTHSKPSDETASGEDQGTITRPRMEPLQDQTGGNFYSNEPHPPPDEGGTSVSKARETLIPSMQPKEHGAHGTYPPPKHQLMGLSPSLQRRVAPMKSNTDENGILHVDELKETLRENHRTQDANKQMKIVIAFIFAALLVSIGATCGCTYAMVRYIKDIEIRDDGLLASTKTHIPVRTAGTPGRGGVAIHQDNNAEGTIRVSRRRLQQFGNDTAPRERIEGEELCQSNCPVADVSCSQARKWFRMLQEETTVSDVQFQVTSSASQVINIKAESWTEIPATITGHDTDALWGQSAPEYFVECPQSFARGDNECMCGVTLKDAIAVMQANDVEMDTDPQSPADNTIRRALHGISSRRRALTSMLHPEHDQFMAAAEDDMVVPPLGALPCRQVARLHDKIAVPGRKAHITYADKASGTQVPVALELKRVHVMAEDEASEPELVLSVDLQLSALRTGIGHAKIVCPHANASTLWLDQSAGANAGCLCHIFGTHGLAFDEHKRLKELQEYELRPSDLRAFQEENNATSEEENPAIVMSSNLHQFQAKGGRRALKETSNFLYLDFELRRQVNFTRFPREFTEWFGRAPDNFSRSYFRTQHNSFYDTESVRSRWCEGQDRGVPDDTTDEERVTGCFGKTPRKRMEVMPPCLHHNTIYEMHRGEHGVQRLNKVPMNGFTYYTAPALSEVEVVFDRSGNPVIRCGEQSFLEINTGRRAVDRLSRADTNQQPIGPFGVQERVHTEYTINEGTWHFQTIGEDWKTQYIAAVDDEVDLCYHGIPRDPRCHTPWGYFEGCRQRNDWLLALTWAELRHRLKANDLPDWVLCANGRSGGQCLSSAPEVLWRVYLRELGVKCQFTAYWEAQLVERKQGMLSPQTTQRAIDRGPGCFPASSTVWRLSTSPDLGSIQHPFRVHMDALRLGDLILTIDRHGQVAWSPVLYMSHASQGSKNTFVELHGRAGSMLRATHQHLLMLAHVPDWRSARAQPASTATPGMYMFKVPDVASATQEGALVSAVAELIVVVSSVQDTGLFAPHTASPDAMLIVDGSVVHELTSNAMRLYSMRQLSLFKWLVSGLHKVLGAQWCCALNDWLLAQHFNQKVNGLAATLQLHLHSFGVKA